MKRIVSLLLLFMIVLPLYACAPAEESVMLMTANDLHYISPTLTENGELFRIAVDNADGKVSHYSGEIVDAFVDKVTEQRPEALILAGDLTFNGARASHEELVKKLSRIEEAGVDVLVIPGNHDVDSTTAYSFNGEEIAPAEALSSHDFAQLYADLGPDKAISKDEYSFSYVYKTSSSVRVFMIDSNCYGKGFVSELTLKWLEEELKKAKADKADVITVTHQNIYAHSELLSFGYTLYNASSLEALLVKYKVKCNLSGHIHVQSVQKQKLTEIATASLTLGSLSYGVISCKGNRLDYEKMSLDVSAWAEKNGLTDPVLLSFNEYAVKYFKDNCRRKVSAAMADSDLSSDGIHLLSETFADINFAYFMGDALNASEYRDGIELWRKKGTSFFSSYIDSMTKGIEKSRCKISVKF